MGIPSIEFLFALLLVAIAFGLLQGAAHRRALLVGCNGLFLWSLVPDWSSLTTLMLFVLSGFAMGRLLQTHKSRLSFIVYMIALLAAFMVLKRYSVLTVILPDQWLAHAVGTVGLSYILFRQIHFLIDVLQEQIPSFTLASYLNYQFNLFGFLSGPIQRYEEFHPTWENPKHVLNGRHEILRAYLRLFVGVIKVSLVSGVFLASYEAQRPWFMQPGLLADASHMRVLARFAVVFYSYPVYLYFNFSGYCDVVIAGGALLGYRMPENFDRPYLARNISDYWTRFHQSLGFWIRDYLFTPMYKAAATRWPRRANSLVFPCYIVAFLLAGVWHGNTMNFAVFGLLHGIGICVGKLWENYLVKRRGRKGLKEYLASKPIRFVAIVLTLHYVALTMLFFPISLTDAMTILQNFVRNLG